MSKKSNTVYVSAHEVEDHFECSIQVHVLNRIFYVTSMHQLYRKTRSIARTHSWYRDNMNALLHLQGKLLNEQKSLCDYNFDLVHVNELTIQWFALNGGSLPQYESTRIENWIINNPKYPLEVFGFSVQGDVDEDEHHVPTAEENMWKIVLDRVQKMQAAQTTPTDAQLEENKEWTMDMVENCFLSYYAFRKFDNIVLWAEMVYKLFTKKSATGALLKKMNQLFAESEVQGLETGFNMPEMSDTLRFLRSGFDSINSLEENPVMKKFYKLYCFMLTQGFLSRLGMTLSDDEYSKLEIRTMSIAFNGKRGLWLAAFDVILFLAEKLYEFKQTGDISVFAHTDTAYAAWSVKCDKIVALSSFTGNLEAHGTTHFTYISELNSAIEEGEAFVKYTKLRSGYESAYLRKRLGQLQMIKAQQTTIKFAQKERKAPFGMLLHGPSGVGKSTFAKMMYYYFGKLRGFEVDDHYLYRRSPTDEYWTNYDTSMWCIQLDDIAFMNPNKASEIDPTLVELLNVVNNVPYVPNQAALEDKGKTPIRAELVIATSNTADLNAYEYFACPLAVQRRLPFIVTLKPKKPFAKEDGMLDPTKLTVDPTRYPDYWTITVQTLKPFIDSNKHERASIEDTKMYEHVEDFLIDYGKSILQHDKNQVAAMGCDNYMSKVGVCPVCMKPTYDCACPQVQGQEIVCVPVWSVSVPEDWYRMVWGGILTTWSGMFYWCLALSCTRYVLSYLLRSYFFRKWFYRTCARIVVDSYVDRILGYLNSITTESRTWVATRGYLRTIIEISIIVAGTYGVYKVFSPKDKDEKPVVAAAEKSVEPTPSVEKVVVEPQGNKFCTTEEQLAKETSSNVWYNSEVELSRFDLPQSSQSLVGKSEEEIRDILSNNIVQVQSVCHVAEGKLTSIMGGVFLSSHYLLTNAHLFKESAKEWDVTIIRRSRTEGISDSITMKVLPADLVLDRMHDLCLFKVLYCPPTKDITKFWSEKSVRCGKLVEYTRRVSGDVTMRTVHGVEIFPDMRVEALNTNVDVYMGRLLESVPETRDGECGSLAVAMTPLGPSIVGIHLLGRSRLSGVMCINKSQLMDMIQKTDALELYPVTVQGGFAPNMTSHGIERKLGDLHPRSTLRYLEAGVANVYGTFDGFRPRFNSKVCGTPLQEEICEHYNYEVDHGKPVMRGWEPWKLNLDKMVSPDCSLEGPIVREITESFYQDIVSGLPENWEKELVVLSNRAAVNGLPGVKYIDAINRKSSMGFPWNTTKRRFLIDEPTEVYPNGVTFDDEFWVRVSEFEALYATNTRACPIFTGALKDTPTPFEKITKKKTRVFSGSPADFAVVTRKRLLSFIRLVQKNKFVFEAGPGTVCQSTEWGKIREYLTSFGEDRMVAGDYGSYDKKMVAMLILAAFQIIAKLHQTAGFTKQECDEIMAIGADTSFSFVNFDGDLIEFFGTNPSGHALTVIINSLVNSLYMRYCYYKLNPDHEARTFKANVHLFTYGDDNAMGVRVGQDWFNHTAIQAVLSTIGVEYTMADKHSVSTPFINIKDVSFLKRTWRYDEDVGAWLAPIDENSIKRSLTVWLPSTSLNEYEKMIEVITAAVNEYFFYGREKFEKERSFLTQLLQKEPYCLYPKVEKIPQWQELVDRFWASSEELGENLNM